MYKIYILLWREMSSGEIEPLNPGNKICLCIYSYLMIFSKILWFPFHSKLNSQGLYQQCLTTPQQSLGSNFPEPFLHSFYFSCPGSCAGLGSHYTHLEASCLLHSLHRKLYISREASRLTSSFFLVCTQMSLFIK